MRVLNRRPSVLPGTFSRAAIFSIGALVALASVASAQTMVVLNVPDTQVIDTTLRNGAYAAINQDGALLLTRSSTVPDWERHTILSFDASSIPDHTALTSATLTLTLKSGLGAAGATRPVTVYRLASAFQECQATWTNRQTGVAWSSPGGDLGESYGTVAVTNTAGAKVTFDVTALVQRAVNGEFGRQAAIALVDVGGGGDAKESYREYHASESSTAASRPQLTIRYGSTSTSTTIDVPAGGDLQAALNSVQRGGTIRLAAGATYTGNFKLPSKAGTSFITITTNTSLPPAGTRIDPSYRPQLATIKSPNGGNALQTATGSGSSYYRIVGVAFEANVGGNGDVISLGRDAQTTLADVPHHIEIDRVLITGDAAVGQKRGIAVNASYVTIANSDIRDIKTAGTDSQAIAGWNTPGSITIRNNYLEAAGENIMFGGAPLKIPNVVPSDILVENNVLTKDVQWRGTSWTVKNLFELKNARRVTLRGNVLEYCWSAGQPGFAIVLTPRNSTGSDPWTVVEDVEISSNTIRSVASVINILGHDDIAYSQQTARIVIKDNLAYDVHSGHWGGTGTFAQIGGEPRDITIDHNTVLHTGNIVLFYSGSYVNASGAKVAGGPTAGFVFTNNMAKHNAYGIFGSGQSSGTLSLTHYAPGSVVRRNVLASDIPMASRYPPDNFFPTVAAFTAGFLDPVNRDYRLVSASPYIGAGTDGKDIGCEFSN
jgi:hypothetical protein